MAVVLASQGSTPRKAGTRAVIHPDGRITGTIGGGALEREAQQRGAVAIRTRKTVVFEQALTGTEVAEAVPICGGVVRVLLDPAVARHRAAFAAAAAAQAQAQRGVLLTRVASEPTTSVRVQWLSEDDLGSWVGFPDRAAIREVLHEETAARFVEDNAVPGRSEEVLVEPVAPCPVLLVVGGGHVGQAVAAQAALVGFEVTVLDDRPEFLDSGLYPVGVTTRCGDVATEVAQFPARGPTYVVLVTRGHQHDAAALAACIRRPLAYVGMIGSRRKVATLRRSFLEAGLATGAEFDRVYAPIGLDLGAVTVPEIAASIVAQMIAVRRTGVAPRYPGS